MQVSRDASAVHWQAVLLHLEHPSQTLMFFLSSVFPNTNCAFIAISALALPDHSTIAKSEVIFDQGSLHGEGAHCS